MSNGAESQKRELADAVKAYLAQEPGLSPGSAPALSRAAGDSGTQSPRRGDGASTAGPGPVVRDEGDKRDLVAAYDRLLAHEATKPRTIEVVEAERWRRFVRPAVIVGGIAIMAYLWLGRPAWLFPRFEPSFGPNLTHPEHALIAADILIGQFRIKSGRAPTSLEDLGVALSGVSMAPVGSGYQLITRVGPRAIVLDHQPGDIPSIREVK